MPELLVMRHAKSDWSTGLIDFDRPLGKRGHDDAPRMAEWLTDNDIAPDSVITSAANRALTTARYVADHIDLDDADFEVRDDLYLASAHSWLQTLHGHSRNDRLMICGHNPGLDHLVDYLSADPLELSDSGKLMTTAAIAHFAVGDWAELSDGSARLIALMRPKELP